MTSAAQTIRKLAEEAMKANPQMTRILTALPRRHGGGGLEPWAQVTAQAVGNADVTVLDALLDRQVTALRKAVKELGADPKRANAAIVSTRDGEAIAVHLLIIEPGNVASSQFASFQAFTESEYFRIANGPHPQRYPYRRMPQPIGHVVEISGDGTFGDKVTTIPEPKTWVDAPIAWTSLPGVEADVFVLDSIDTTDPLAHPPGSLPGAEKEDHFLNLVTQAIGMSPPSLRHIRAQGEDDGFRDGRGNVIE